MNIAIVETKSIYILGNLTLGRQNKRFKRNIVYNKNKDHS